MCSIFDSMHVSKDESDQLNFEEMEQLEGTKEEETPRLEMKPLPKGLKYVYLGNQQTYLVLISSQLISNQEVSYWLFEKSVNL